MIGKKTEIDFGTVFINGTTDASHITSLIEKSINLNGCILIDEGAYKHRMSAADRPMRLKVTVELAEV